MKEKKALESEVKEEMLKTELELILKELVWGEDWREGSGFGDGGKAIIKIILLFKKPIHDNWEKGFLAGSDTAMKTIEAVLGTSSISLTNSKEDADTHS